MLSEHDKQRLREAQADAERRQMERQIDDLAMLVRRLARQLPSGNPVAVSARDYLRRNDLLPSILRDAAQQRKENGNG